MYYSYHCSRCDIIFYTYNEDKWEAARTLYYGIKQHLIDSGEDDEDTEFDDTPEINAEEIYHRIGKSRYAPEGGQEL